MKLKNLSTYLVILLFLLIAANNVFSQSISTVESSGNEPINEQPPASADIDVINPLHYIDVSVDWLMTTINEGIDASISYLRLAEEGVSEFTMFGRFRHRWLEQVDFDFDESNYDRQLFHNQFWRFGFSTVTTEFRIDFEFMHAIELLSTRLYNKKDQDVWDVHRFTVTLTGFAGDSIRFPIPVSTGWGNFLALIGRGPITFGRGRLLGSNDSPNIGDCFDSVVFALLEENTGKSLNFFGVRKVKYINRSINEAEHDTYLWGLSLIGVDPLNQTLNQASLESRALLRSGDYDFNFFPAVNPKELRSTLGFDIYILWARHMTRDVESELGRIGIFHFLNLGVRGGIELVENWIFEFETNYQFGRYGNCNLYAHALHAEINGGVEWFLPISFTLSADYASGDNDPQDGKIRTFQDLYAKSDNRFGGFNFWGWSNLVHVGAAIRFQIANSLLLQGSYHFLENVTGKDAIYGPRGEVILAKGVNSNFISMGTVFDCEIQYHYSQRIKLYAGISYFSPSSRFTASNLNDNAIQYFMTAEVRFE